MWVRWLLQVAFAGEELLVVGMDETSVQHQMPGRLGNAIDVPGERASLAQHFFGKADAKQNRAHTTLVAFACNDNGMQKYMPQLFLPSSKHQAISVRDRALFAGIGLPTETWEGTGGWVNSNIMKRILTRLRKIIRGRRPGVCILLVLDAASQHISNEVLIHAAQLQIYLLLVPSHLTWLLQVLDVYVFALLKRRMHELQTTDRLASSTGALAPGAWIQHVGQAVQEVLVNGMWADSFAKLGVQVGREGLSARLEPYMPVEAEIVPRPLRDDEIEHLVGKHRLNVECRFLMLRGHLSAGGRH